MGYFTNAFVLTSPPDFDAICAVIGPSNVVGYKHQTRDLWLLDIWKPRRRGGHTRFCDLASQEIEVDPSVIGRETTTFLETLDRLREVLSEFVSMDDRPPVELALAIAAATRAPVFYFAADDELTDLACRAIPGNIVTFGCRFEVISIQYGGGRTSVTPLRSLEDEDEPTLPAVVEILQRLPGIALEETRDLDGGRHFYENPRKHWPQEAGNATDILGLGTWDPFKDFETCFDEIFARAI